MYRKVLRYKDNKALAELWIKRLTDCKQPSIGSIEKREWLTAALARLEPFPGLWDNFELGNWRKHIALRCKEIIICYLTHIYEVWNKITLEIAVIQRTVDINTVRKLQLRAPTASKLDREYIRLNMDNGTLFPSLTDRGLRDEVKRALLNLGEMIPTFKSFHKNMKYIAIGVEIIKRQLLNSTIDESLDPKDEGSLYKTIRSRWSAPDQARVEFRERDFRRTIIDQEHLFHFCYMQIFCSALRNFTGLGTHRTLIGHSHQEIIHGSPDPAYQLQFSESAQRLGVEHDRPIHSLVDPEKTKHPQLPLDAHGEGIKYRCGVPYTKQYEQLRTRLFLPTLSQVQDEPENLNPSVLFMARDFVSAFFGPNQEIWAAASCSEPITRSDTLMASLKPHVGARGTERDSPSELDAHLAHGSRVTSCELTQDWELHDITLTELEMPRKLSSCREDQAHPKKVCVSDAGDSEDNPQLYRAQSPGKRLAIESNNSPEPPNIPTSAHLEAPFELVLESTEIIQYPVQTLTISPRLPVEDHNAERYRGSNGVGGSPRIPAASPAIDVSDRSGRADMEKRAEKLARDVVESADSVGVVNTASAVRLVNQSISVAPSDKNDGRDPRSVYHRGELATTTARQSPSVDNAEDEGRRPILQLGSADEGSCRSPLKLVQLDVHDSLDPITSISHSRRASPQVESIDRDLYLSPEQSIFDGQVSDYERRSLLYPEYVIDGERGWSGPQSGVGVVADDSGSKGSESRRSVLQPKYTFEPVAEHGDFVRSKWKSRRPEYGNNPGGSGSRQATNTACAASNPDFVDDWEREPPTCDTANRSVTWQAPEPRKFKFIEFNGMRASTKATTDMDEYLKRRRKWRGLIIRDGISKTMRFEDITKHMVSGSSDREYRLVKVTLDDFPQIKTKRWAESNTDTSRLAYSHKRQRNS